MGLRRTLRVIHSVAPHFSCADPMDSQMNTHTEQLEDNTELLQKIIFGALDSRYDDRASQ